MTLEELEDNAKGCVNDLGLNWNDLTEAARFRAKRIMSKDYSCSPNGEGQKENRYSTTYLSQGILQVLRVSRRGG